jgi:hypothetical protein
MFLIVVKYKKLIVHCLKFTALQDKILCHISMRSNIQDVLNVIQPNIYPCFKTDCRIYNQLQTASVSEEPQTPFKLLSSAFRAHFTLTQRNTNFFLQISRFSKRCRRRFLHLGYVAVSRGKQLPTRGVLTGPINLCR